MCNVSLLGTSLPTAAQRQQHPAELSDKHIPTEQLLTVCVCACVCVPLMLLACRLALRWLRQCCGRATTASSQWSVSVCSQRGAATHAPCLRAAREFPCGRLLWFSSRPDKHPG